MSLDDIECYNIDDVPAVKDPKVGTPLFDTTTKDTDDARKSEDNSQWIRYYGYF